MDQSGFIFAKAPPNASSLGRICLLRRRFDVDRRRSVRRSHPGTRRGSSHFCNFSARPGSRRSARNVQSDEDFTVPLQEGFSIYASFGRIRERSLATAARAFLDALTGQEQNLEYVDLRFGDKVYYKLKGQSQQTAPQ